MNLVRAELERLAARRFVQVMLALLAVAFLVTLATTSSGSRVPTGRELAAAQELAAEQRAATERLRQECLDARDQPTTGPAPADCESIRPQDVGPEDYLDRVFVFEREMTPLLMFLAAFLALFGLLVGASFIGTEFTSGGMTNLLLWRPRRTEVLAAKLGTVVAAVAAVSVLASLLYVGAFWLAARTTGLVGQVDAAAWGSYALLLGRGVVLAALATALGAAIAAVGRHTAAALGAVAGYAILWEIGMRIVMEVTESPRPERLMLSTYVGAWMARRLEFFSAELCGDGPGVCGTTYTVGWPSAIVVLMVVVGAAVTAAFVTFRRRDLT